MSNLTKQIALDYARDNIRCNAICPGCKFEKPSPSGKDGLLTEPPDTQTAIFVNTINHLDDDQDIRDRHPLHGVGMPEDIVGAAIFLASPEARWITGVCLPVDGGYTAQ